MLQVFSCLFLWSPSATASAMALVLSSSLVMLHLLSSSCPHQRTCVVTLLGEDCQGWLPMHHHETFFSSQCTLAFSPLHWTNVFFLGRRHPHPVVLPPCHSCPSSQLHEHPHRTSLVRNVGKSQSEGLFPSSRQSGKLPVTGRAFSS